MTGTAIVPVPEDSFYLQIYCDWGIHFLLHSKSCGKCDNAKINIAICGYFRGFDGNVKLCFGGKNEYGDKHSTY